MTRAAKAAAFSLEQCRAQYVELASELQLMQQEHERLMAALSDEQRAATQDRDPEIDKELKELDVWIEAMDDELMESTPDPKQLARQSRKVEETAKQLEKDFRQLASDLSAD